MQQYIGGLVGRSAGTSSTARNEINRCYATGALTAESQYNDTGFYYFSVGGLVGFAQDTNINESYATGKVDAKKGADTRGPINAGGLAAFVRDNCSISNSWASGAVLADNPYTSGNIWAGGLAGTIYSLNSNTVTIQYCYSLSSVSARRNSGTAYAGGLVGQFYNNSTSPGTLEVHYSAYLGPSVSATSCSTSEMARVYGSIQFTPNPILSNNYASTVAVVGRYSTTYDGSLPIPVNFGTNNDHDSKQGKDATDMEFFNSGWWKSVMKFDQTYWDFVGATQDGAPLLRRNR
jgi:hypothetical protein